MLGQPVYFLTPGVVGVRLTGWVREGVTATDVSAHAHAAAAEGEGRGAVRRVLRPAAALPVVDRATIANMASEYGVARWVSSRSMPSRCCR